MPFTKYYSDHINEDETCSMGKVIGGEGKRPLGGLSIDEKMPLKGPERNRV